MTLEFLSSLNGHVYKAIQKILLEGKGLVIKPKGEEEKAIFDNDCEFTQTMEGIMIKDGKYVYFYTYDEIREVHEY